MRSGNGEADTGGDAGLSHAQQTIWRVPEWERVPRLVHGFLGRALGFGPGPFSLATIRDRLTAAGETPGLVLAARQVHGVAVVSPEHPTWATVDWGDAPERLPVADALVTASADVIVTIRTADCVPVLLVAPRARAAAAVHAGWRGLLAGIVETAVCALAERYGARAAEVEAAIGPAIGGCCYEFGAEPHARFVARYGTEAMRAWRAPEPTRDSAAAGDAGLRGYLDLRSIAALALARAGVPRSAVRIVGPCTAEHPAALHSYRRDGAGAGRQLSYVGWRGD